MMTRARETSPETGSKWLVLWRGASGFAPEGRSGRGEARDYSAGGKIGILFLSFSLFRATPSFGF